MRSATEQIVIGGQPVVTLQTPEPTGREQPAFLQASIAPGREMMLLQVRAYLPGPGEFDVLHMPDLEAFAHKLNDSAADPFGNATFSAGGAILLPFANRIRGRLSPDGQTIQTKIAGETVALPANTVGKEPGAERCAMHGLLLKAAFHDVTRSRSAQEDKVTGHLKAGDFGGHWLSSTDVTIEHMLTRQAYTLRVTATNAGRSVLPMGAGWHPYFALPGGDRARVHVPASKRLAVNNYDEVFPTGEILPVEGTEYDFAISGGRPLGDMYLDDCFVGLHKSASNETFAEVVDPGAVYGLRIVARSPDVSAIQVYAPPDKPFVVVEPQLNRADPFGPEWPPQVNTGMVMLEPGQAVVYQVELRLFCC